MAKSDTMQTVTDDLQELGSRAGEIAQEKIGQLKASAANLAEQGRERVQEMEQSLEEYVVENPLKSLLIAAGVGLLVGRLCLRR